MTFQELLIYIKNRYPSSLSETEVEEHINEVYKDLSRLFTKDVIEEEEKQTNLGEENYTLSSPSRRIREVHLDVNERKRLRSMKAEARIFPRKEGTPKRWFPYGVDKGQSNIKQMFGLDPIPDSQYAIYILYEPLPEGMAEDTDIPSYIPEEHHYLIGWGAMALIAGKEEDYNAAQHWDIRYRSAVNEILVSMGIYPENVPEASKQSAVNQQVQQEG